MSTPLFPGLLAARTDRQITVAGTAFSHADLLGAAGAVAGSLQGRHRVAVHATPTMTTVTAVVGALLAGVEVVPVPPDSGSRELPHMLTDAAPDAWLGPAAEGSDLASIPVDVAARASYDPPEVDPEHTAFVLYTSGTTGLPKGVQLSRRAVAAGLDGLADAWGWTERDVLVHGLPLFHVHGLVLGVLGPLRVGAGITHVGKGTPEAYAAATGTMYFAVPTIWSRIAESPAHASRLAGARLLVSGSAALPVPVFERLRDLTGLEVAERYGMSETLITVATRSDGARRAGWVGVPIDGVETRLRDESGNPVPQDGESVGRLEVRGRTLFSGYLNRAEETAESFTDDGWFRTGDVAVIDPDGAHRIVGRESVDLIKSAGYRIGAGEIESTLLGHEAVAECAVIGVPDPDLGQRIVAFVVPRRTRVSAADLTSYVGDHLSAHKRPREVVFVDALPRNDMGKVQKKRLLDG